MRVTWIVFLVGCGFQSPIATTDGTGGASDAPDAGFDYARCPASYDVVAIPGPSRYRLIADGHRAWEQSDACARDTAGATHLVVMETLKELADIKAFVTNPGMGLAGDSLWIGGVQLNTATSLGDSWLGFDGAPLLSNGWGGNEPNDKYDGENNHDEQFVRIARGAPYFIDDAGDKNFGALCECNGKPIAANAATAIDGYRSPPS